MKGKMTALLLVIAMILSAMPMAFAAEEGKYATRGEVCEMLLAAADDYNPGVRKTDILKGYADGELHEEQSVTRAEALVMLGRAFGVIPEITGSNKYLAIPQEDFTDIPSWAETELADVLASGIAGGKTEGAFSPDDYVTVGEMRLFIQRMYCVFGTKLKDNFFAAVNKEYLDSTTLPKGKSVTGGLYTDKVDRQLVELMKEISASNPEKIPKRAR